VKELMIFKVAKNVVEGGEVSNIIVLPRFRELIQPSENCIPNSFDYMRQEKNK
jgi:hypothetical protein